VLVLVVVGFTGDDDDMDEDDGGGGGIRLLRRQGGRPRGLRRDVNGVDVLLSHKEEVFFVVLLVGEVK